MTYVEGQGRNRETPGRKEIQIGQAFQAILGERANKLFCGQECQKIYVQILPKGFSSL